MSIISIDKLKESNQKLNQQIQSFTEQPWASGVTLLVCVVIAMLLANLPWTRDVYSSFLETNVTASIQSPLQHDGTRVIDWCFPKDMNIEKFINDFLMVIFFFTVGLEIKGEVAGGELSSPKKAMMPVISALGGMMVPALIFTIFNHGTMAASGWGIPTATDIAFAVGIMSIMGNKVPVSLKVFLVALAIADDLGAILVVALFYGGTINLPLLAISLIILAVIYLMNLLGEKRMMFYLIPAAAVWFLFYYSGIHSTMSGVVMAFLIPMDMGKTLDKVLNPWVNFIIMPVFALANAGVQIPSLEYCNIFEYLPEIGSVGMGIYFGLLLGKPIGITLASFLAIKLKVGVMPTGATWKMLFAVACLGGIGFTMSIFVDTLSFNDFPEIAAQLQARGKIAVLMGSLSAGILGSALISVFSRTKIDKCQ